METRYPPLLGFCAYGSGTGKTTLLTQLIPALIERGLRISVIKHAHHRFDIDHPGKDSYALRQAGAVQTMVGSATRWALMTELSRTPCADQEPNLDMLVAQMDPALSDLIVVEGFRHADIHKIEVHRPSLGTPLLALDDPTIFAVASDQPIDAPCPHINLNDVPAMADFIVDWLSKRSAVRSTS